MTLWHKPTEKPKGNWNDILVQSISGDYYLFYARDCLSWNIVKKWCYLSDLLKHEKENKRLKNEVNRLVYKIMEQQEEITNLRLENL